MACMSIGAPDHGDQRIFEVLEAIADYEEVDIMGLPPLAKVVDSDALVNLLEEETKVVIEFEYEGYLVSMDSRGETSIEEL